MVTTIISADVIGTNQTYTFNTAGDIFVLAAGTRFVGNGYSYLYGVANGINVTIDGYMWLEGDSGGSGSPFYFGGGNRITIGEDAQMVLRSATTPSWGGLMLGVGSGGGNDFTNHGQITTTGGTGVVVDGGTNSLRNYGTIDVTNGSFSYGSGSNDALLNTGMITGAGTNTGTLIMINGSNNSLTNSGDIVINTVNAEAIRDNSTSGVTFMTNTGNITSDNGFAITSLTANLNLNNAGLISGLYTAITAQGLANIITNTGHINGNIVFGAGIDIYRGIGGTLTGNIAGGGGSDNYFTSDSNLTIVEAASGGSDTVHSTVSFRLAAEIETLRLLGFAQTGIGNASSNTIIGNGANNRIFGLFGFDNLVGAEGDDTIGGGDGNDTLQGGDGDDWLRGAVGNDSLTAGGDNDTLIGAIGVDTLRGGIGNDSFVFVRQSDSGITVATSDLIADFVRGQDVIDLSGIDARTTTPVNDAFTFIGAAAFSNVAGQLRYSSAAGVTTVAMDVNGNGVADMTIRLTGTLVLTAQDFIL